VGGEGAARVEDDKKGVSEEVEEEGGGGRSDESVICGIIEEVD
jgi:hypothetical protein